jgi:hypothetical protein
LLLEPLRPMLAPIGYGHARGVRRAGKGGHMRFNNVLVRALGAVLVTVLLNGSVVGAFTHVAAEHGARAASNAPASA